MRETRSDLRPETGNAGSAPVPAVALRMRAEREQIAVARHAVVALATEHGATPRMQTHVALATSEAVSNVVQHAYGRGGEGMVDVTAEVANGLLEICVDDEGLGLWASTESEGAGIGLAVLAHVSDYVKLESTPARGTRVRIRFLL